MARTRSGETNFRDEQARLQAHIKAGNYAPVYLVMGEQDYLRTQFRDNIRTALVPADDTMNSTYYTGDQFTITEVVDLADTMPFFAERRVITIENSWLFSKGAGSTDALTDYLSRMPETTHLVFVERSPDKSSRLYRQIKRIGFVLDCVTPSQQDLANWTAGLFRKAGLGITDDAMQQFLSNMGDEMDMLRIRSEADKLIAYCAGRDGIRIEDVRIICSAQVKDRIFDMMSAITSRNVTEALMIYTELLQRQTAPQVILALMIRNYNQMLQVGELAAGGTSDQEIAGMLHLNAWVLRNKIRPALRGYSRAELIAALDACLQKDMDYKSGRINDQLAVEQLIIERGAGSAAT